MNFVLSIVMGCQMMEFRFKNDDFLWFLTFLSKQHFESGLIANN